MVLITDDEYFENSIKEWKASGYGMNYFHHVEMVMTYDAYFHDKSYIRHLSGGALNGLEEYMSYAIMAETLINALPKKALKEDVKYTTDLDEKHTLYVKRTEWLGRDLVDVKVMEKATGSYTRLYMTLTCSFDSRDPKLVQEALLSNDDNIAFKAKMGYVKVEELQGYYLVGTSMTGELIQFTYDFIKFILESDYINCTCNTFIPRSEIKRDPEAYKRIATDGYRSGPEDDARLRTRHLVMDLTYETQSVRPTSSPSVDDNSVVSDKTEEEEIKTPEKERASKQPLSNNKIRAVTQIKQENVINLVNEEKKEEEEEEDFPDLIEVDEYEGKCMVCFDKPADTMVLPCMHHVCCSDCSKKLRETRDKKTCIACRNPIEMVLEEQ